MFRYFFSALLILLGVEAWSQSQDTTVRKPKRVDTVSFIPTGLRVGTDVIALVRSRAPSFKGWEMTFDVDLSRYYLTVEYGYWSTRQSLDNFQLLASTANPVLRTSGSYNNEGYYFRFGTDVNFLLKDPEKNMFFLGLRYCMSSFNENVNYVNQPSYAGFPAFSQNISNGSVSGSWVEVTTGMRIRVYKAFWMGYTARLKFAPSTSEASNFESYDMPGYGIISETPYWGFNYQLFWRFDWDKLIKGKKKKSILSK
jgi:hypothetical protein